MGIWIGLEYGQQREDAHAVSDTSTSLALAMFQSLPLAVILTFSDRVIYARYSSVDDQALAGVIMWVPGSLPLLLSILRLIVQLSSGRVVMEGHHA